MFRLEPVQGLFGTIGTVSGDCVRLPVGWVRPTATGNLGCGKPDGGGRVGNTALESIHVVCVNADKKFHKEGRKVTRTLF